MSVPEITETCRYPGCDRPALPVAETGGRPPGYCADPEHTAQTAYRERRRRAARGELVGEEGEGGERLGGERPMSLAIASVGQLAKRLADDMARTREVLALISDSGTL